MHLYETPLLSNELTAIPEPNDLVSGRNGFGTATVRTDTRWMPLARDPCLRNPCRRVTAQTSGRGDFAKKLLSSESVRSIDQLPVQSQQFPPCDTCTISRIHPAFLLFVDNDRCNHRQGGIRVTEYPFDAIAVPNRKKHYTSTNSTLVICLPLGLIQAHFEPISKQSVSFAVSLFGSISTRNASGG